MVSISKCGSPTSMVGLRQHHLLKPHTPAVTRQGGAVGTWRIRSLFCVLCVHPPRTNRGSDVPIRSPKAETQKQQTHLNHVAAAVLISMSAERRVTQTTAPGRENCHTLRDCVVTQSPQAACSRSTDVLCWRLQQRPMAAVHVCCKHTHAQAGNSWTIQDPCCAQQ
jgi:hypothetical protein